MAVFLVTVPVAWIGIGLAAGVAYFGNPLMANFWLGPLGPVAHVGGTVISAGIAAAVAAGAVRSTIGRNR